MLQCVAFRAQPCERAEHRRLVGEILAQLVLQIIECRAHRRGRPERRRLARRLEAAQRGEAAVERRVIGVEALAHARRTQHARLRVALTANLRIGDERVRADRSDNDCYVDQQSLR
jgi:hypothetical protein